MKRKVLAVVLCLAMVVCFIPTFSFAATSQMKVGDQNSDGVIEYTSLGDSISVGFGAGDSADIVGIYTYDWKCGYERASSAAYSAQLAAKYKDTMNMWSGAMCGLRAEDVINFINVDKFGADDYFYGFYNNTFKNCFLSPEKSTGYNPLTYTYSNPVYYDYPRLEEMNKKYTEQVKNADFITITAGGNNYFTYLASKISNMFMTPEDMMAMYAAPEGGYYDYTMSYAYDYNAGDEAGAGSVVYVDLVTDPLHPLTYFSEKQNDRTLKSVVMATTLSDPTNMYSTVLKKFSDYTGDVINPTDGKAVVAGTKTEQEYVADMVEFYGQYDDRFKTVTTFDGLNEVLMKIYEETMSANTYTENLLRFYDKATVSVYNIARTSAIGAAKVADRLAGKNSTNLTRQVTAVFDFIKSYLYTTGAVNEAMPMLVSYVHELNPNAKVAITGLPPAFCDYSIKITDKLTINLADILPVFYTINNLKMKKIANDNSSFCKAIDITKAEMISQENMRTAYQTDPTLAETAGIKMLGSKDRFGNQYRKTVGALEFGISALSEVPLSHPSAAGHKYIAEQLDNAFDFAVEKKSGIRAAIENIWNAIFNKTGKSFLENLFNFDYEDIFKNSFISKIFA